MKKTFLAVCLLAGLTLNTAFADSRSDAVLGKLSSTIDSFDSYKVDFTVQLDGDDITGLYIVSGDRYYMSVEGVEVFCDGKQRYEVSHDNMEVVIDNVNTADNNILTNPTRAFSFPAGVYTHSYAGTDSMASGKAVEVVSVKPAAGTRQSFKKIVLGIDPVSGLPAEVLYKADGLSDDIRIIIDRFEPDTEVYDVTFRFDRTRFPDYELVDFR